MSPERQTRQGNHLPDVTQLATGADGAADLTETPFGVIVVSQCCDLAKLDPSHIPLAAAVTELGETTAALAASGRIPRYVKVPHLRDGLYVDLGRIGPILPSAFHGRQTTVGTNLDRAHFAARVARYFGRFAYPDEVQPQLARLQKKIRKKVSSSTSPLGMALQRIHTIRIEAEWDGGPPWDLHFVFVLSEGELPLFDAAHPTNPNARTWTLEDLCSKIATLPPGSAELADYWSLMGERLIADTIDWAGTDAVVGEATVEVVQESEFSYFRYRRSADLDIDDLSDESDPDGL